jgi:uncharacterized protein (DUF1697 family)
MAELLRTVADAGYPDAVSVLASGNVIVRSDRPVQTGLVEDAIHASHGFRSEVFVRSEKDVRSLVRANPFAEVEGKIEVVFLPRAPDAVAIEAVAKIATGPDLLRVLGREIFWWRPLPLEPAIPKETALRRAIGVDSTRRTLGTVERIIAKLDSTPG